MEKFLVSVRKRWFLVSVRKRCYERVVVEANSKAEAIRKAKALPLSAWNLRVDDEGENPTACLLSVLKKLSSNTK